MILLELAENYAENQNFKEAKMRAVAVIDRFNEMPNINLARAYIVLLRVSINEQSVDDAEEYFKKAIAVLQFNLGRIHPFYESLYTTVADFYISIDRLDAAEALIKNNLIDCMLQCLGVNHQRTGHTYAFLASI